jgi:hypothetical protein
VKPQKQPRLDVGGPAQTAQLREAAPLLEALKAPLVDENVLLTPRGRNFEAALTEQRKAAMKVLDPVEERRRLQRLDDERRAKICDMRLNGLRLQIPAITSVLRAFGEISPEAQALANRVSQDLNIDVVDTMKRGGLPGVEALLTEYETKIVPDLKERCGEIQNRFMQNLAAERSRLLAEKADNDAKKLGPDRALQLLETSGVRLRLFENELQVSGSLNEGAEAILKMYRAAIVERLAERERWRTVE